MKNKQIKITVDEVTLSEMYARVWRIKFKFIHQSFIS